MKKWLLLIVLTLISAAASAQQWGPILLGTASSGGGGGYVWSATQINSNLGGGGTTSLSVTGTPGTALPAYGHATVASSSGKYYWEVKVTANTPGDYIGATFKLGFGLGESASAITNGTILGTTSDTLGVVFSSATTGNIYAAGGNQASITLDASVASGDVMACALDMVHQTFWFRDVTSNSSWFGSSSAGDPATNSNGLSIYSSMTNAPVLPAVWLHDTGDTVMATFAASFAGTVPSGFSALP